jgi:hypothetical protein
MGSNHGGWQGLLRHGANTRRCVLVLSALVTGWVFCDIGRQQLLFSSQYTWPSMPVLC